MQDKTEAFWTDVLRKRFPTVILRQAYDIPEESDVPFYNVFMLPDDKFREFTEFYIEEVWKIVEESGIPAPHFLEVGVTDTKTFYPDVYREAQSRRGLSVGKKAQKRTPRKPVKTVARAMARQVK